MFDFLNFEWLLKFICILAKASGFVFITIDFNCLAAKKYKWSHFTNLLSVSVTLFLMTYDGFFDIDWFTKSELMTSGANLIQYLTVWVSCLVKFVSLLQTERFVRIISDLQWCHLKVSTQSLMYKGAFVNYVDNFFWRS